MDVPKELVEDVDLILGEIRMALREDGVPVSEDDLSFERPEGDTRGAFGGIGPQEAAMLFVGSIVAQQITQKYAQEVLWPRLKPFCEDATDALMHFLTVLAGGLPPR